jgi:hypothetical protein
MTGNVCTEESGASSVLVRITGAEKLWCTVMYVTADGRKLPQYVIFKRKTIPKGKFAAGIYTTASRIYDGWCQN